MSSEALAWGKRQRVGSGRKATLLAVCDVADEHGIHWHGIAYLAETLECGRSTILRHLAELEERGVLMRVQRRRGNGSRTSSVTVLAPTGDRGTMRDPRQHGIYGERITAALSPDSRPDQSPDLSRPKSQSGTPRINSESTERPPDSLRSSTPKGGGPDQAISGEVISISPAQRVAECMSEHARRRHGVDAASKQYLPNKTWVYNAELLLATDNPYLGGKWTEKQLCWVIQEVCADGYWGNRVRSVTRLRSEWGEICKSFQQRRDQRANGNGRPLSKSERLEARTAERMARIAAMKAAKGESA